MAFKEVIVIGFLDYVLNRNKELEHLFDFDIFQGDIGKRVHMKRLAVETCINFLGRTVSQSEFRVKEGETFKKDELYYRLNVRPNKNMTASMFWQTVVYKLIYDNECLIIQADDGDLLIADDFVRNQYAVYEDTFSKVKIKEFEFMRTFSSSNVIYLQYNNEALSPLIDGLFADYGELFGRLLSSQKRKNQIRSTVKVDVTTLKTKEGVDRFQKFIDNLYSAFSNKDVAVVPEQNGYEYKEHSKSSGSNDSVEEINKVTNGFLDKVAMAMGIPTGLIYGDMADVEKQTKNYMTFTVSPLIKKINDEANAKFFTMDEFFAGNRVDIRKVSYQSIFDLATAIDKLVSSSTFTPNELRDEAGFERSDDPKLDEHMLTKNYESVNQNTLEGGENKNNETVQE